MPQEWLTWLEGTLEHFLIWADHKNLVYLCSVKRLNSRQGRWSLVIIITSSYFPLTPGIEYLMPFLATSQLTHLLLTRNPLCRLLRAANWEIKATVCEAHIITLTLILVHHSAQSCWWRSGSSGVMLPSSSAIPELNGCHSSFASTSGGLDGLKTWVALWLPVWCVPRSAFEVSSAIALSEMLWWRQISLGTAVSDFTLFGQP